MTAFPRQTAAGRQFAVSRTQSVDVSSRPSEDRGLRTPRDPSKLPTKGTLFINRQSGVRLSPREMDEFVRACEGAGLEIVELTPELDVAQTCRERIRRGVHLMIAAGGDGTVN